MNILRKMDQIDFLESTVEDLMNVSLKNFRVLRMPAERLSMKSRNSVYLQILRYGRKIWEIITNGYYLHNNEITN